MRRHLTLSVITVLIGILLVGCGRDSLKEEIIESQSLNNNIKIHSDYEQVRPERNELTWGELDQLTSYKNIRKTWDDELNIIRFDESSKNGVLFVDLDGNWSGNNTLYNVFQNKAFTEKIWNDNKLKSILANKAIEEFSDISNETTGIFASINAYYNIFPTNKDNTSGLTDNISRAEAMSAIYRCDTPVIYEDENIEFTKAVGISQYNIYASNLSDCSYLDYTNGSLCYSTYNQDITRAEALYIIVNRYFRDEYNNQQVTDVGFSDCINAGDLASELGIKDKHAWQAYTLDYALQTDTGCPEELYKALIVAYNHGLISNETKWNQPLMGGTLLNYLINTYLDIYNRQGFSVNASLGKNVGENLVDNKTDEPEEDIKEETIGSVVVSHIKDVTNIDDLIKIYGDEIEMTDSEIQEAYSIADEWTFEAEDKWMEVAYCNYLNVRKGPSTDYAILKSIPSGTKCHVVAKCSDNGWYRVIADGKIVYQCGVYFK